MAWNKATETAAPTTRNRARWSRWLPVALFLVAGAIGMALWMTGRAPSSVESNASAPAANPKATAKLTHKTAATAKKKSPKEAVREAMPKKVPRKHKERRKGEPVEMFSHLSGEDRKMAEAVQAALDNDDLKAVAAAAEKALSSTNSEVRLNAVEALGWFGAEALPELTGCMADADEDVQQAAENQWELAVQELESSDDQFNIAIAAFSTLNNEDQLTSIGGLLGCAATDMIDGEEDAEKAAENRLKIVQALADIIEGGSAKNIAAAKEAYNDITGNEWQGFDEADRYLADPENYEPKEN